MKRFSEIFHGFHFLSRCSFSFSSSGPLSRPFAFPRVFSPIALQFSTLSTPPESSIFSGSPLFSSPKAPQKGSKRKAVSLLELRLGEDTSSPNHLKLFSLLANAKNKIENYELEAAEKLLSEAEKLDLNRSAAFLHLVSILRLKQRRIDEAAQARDEMLIKYPELLHNPVILSNAAWLYVHQKQPTKALVLLDEAEKFTDAPKDIIYIRALIHESLGDLEQAEKVLRTAVFPHNNRLIDFVDTVDVKLAMQLTEVLVLLGRPNDAIEMCPAIIEASKVINGPNHVVTLCAMEGHASALRGMGKPKEALEILEPVVNELTRQLGPHELALTAVGLLGKIQMEIYLTSHVESLEKKQPINEDLLKRAKEALAEWVQMAKVVNPNGPDHQAALQHQNLLDLLIALEKGEEGNTKHSPKSEPGKRQGSFDPSTKR